MSTEGRTPPPEITEALACVKDDALSPSEAAARIIALCTKRVHEALREPVDPHASSTPGLEEFLWLFWSEIFADIVWDRPSLHGRLIEIMKNMKKRGRVKTERENFNGPQIPEASPECTEGVLPWYPQVREEYLNLCRFMMQVWAENVADFAVWGIWMMREGLEDFDAGRLDDVVHYGDDGLSAPTALAVEEASWCVQIAGEKMYRSTVIEGPKGNDAWPENWGAPGRGGKRWMGVDGYHPDRWKLWKSIFVEIANVPATSELARQAGGAAKVAIEAMTKIEDAVREAAQLSS